MSQRLRVFSIFPLLGAMGAWAQPTVAPPPETEKPLNVEQSQRVATQNPQAVEPSTSGWEGKISGSLRLGARGVSRLMLESGLQGRSLQTLDSRLRVLTQLRRSRWNFLGEFDAVSGNFGLMPSSPSAPQRTPLAEYTPFQLRQLFVEYKADNWLVRGGQQATAWGLGLLANNGSKDAQPGDFGESRFGDLTYRALLAGRPFASSGPGWSSVEPILALEWIERDDFAVWSQGENAWQAIAALRYTVDSERNVGAYVVRRQQRAPGTSTPRATDVWVVDAAGKWKWQQDEGEWTAGFEAVGIFGRSSMARSDTFPVQEVRQFGAAAKGGYKTARYKYLFDGGFASGDQNPYDNVQQAFRFDPDYRVGLVLFDQVLGWQSARAQMRAQDPLLVGIPQEGSELISTRGSVTGAWYIFPRVNYSAKPWLDLYGGPLLSWTTARLTDPFETRVQGGTPVNALGGRAGSYLGTELDLGVQAKLKTARGFLINATGEVGYFMPGDAFVNASGTSMANVLAARLRVWMEL